MSERTSASPETYNSFDSLAERIRDVRADATRENDWFTSAVREKNRVNQTIDDDLDIARWQHDANYREELRAAAQPYVETMYASADSFAAALSRLDDVANSSDDPYLVTLVADETARRFRSECFNLGYDEYLPQDERAKIHKDMANSNAYEEYSYEDYIFQDDEQESHRQRHDAAQNDMQQGLQNRYRSLRGAARPTVANIVAENGLRPHIDHALGFASETLSEDSARAFIGYLGKATKAEFDRLASASQQFETPAERKVFAEAFLATEFGDDFGDRLLTIAEHATGEQATRIFEIIGEYRIESEQFGDMYKAYDPELAAATEKAISERLADMIVVVEHVAEGGKMTVDTAPHQGNADYIHDGRFDITIASIDQAVDTMSDLLKTFQLRREIIESDSTRVSKVVANEAERGYQIYRFRHAEKGDVLLHVRSEGSGMYDRAFEYGNYDGVEATISWVVNPSGSHQLASDKDPSGVSIRFDREGRALGEAPNSPDRSPIREDGLMSVDISSGLGKANTVPVQIGRMIAAGNKLRAEETGEKISLHHNTNYFAQEKYGSAAGFKGLADYVKTMAETRIFLQKSRRVGRQAVAKAAA